MTSNTHDVTLGPSATHPRVASAPSAHTDGALPTRDPLPRVAHARHEAVRLPHSLTGENESPQSRDRDSRYDISTQTHFHSLK